MNLRLVRHKEEGSEMGDWDEVKHLLEGGMSWAAIVGWLVTRHEATWAECTVNDWAFHLGEEMRELVQAIEGNHEHPWELEAAQIASIAINMLRHHAGDSDRRGGITRRERMMWDVNDTKRAREYLRNSGGMPLLERAIDELERRECGPALRADLERERKRTDELAARVAKLERRLAKTRPPGWFDKGEKVSYEAPLPPNVHVSATGTVYDDELYDDEEVRAAEWAPRTRVGVADVPWLCNRCARTIPAGMPHACTGWYHKDEPFATEYEGEFTSPPLCGVTNCSRPACWSLCNRTYSCHEHLVPSLLAFGASRTTIVRVP